MKQSLIAADRRTLHPVPKKYWLVEDGHKGFLAYLDALKRELRNHSYYRDSCLHILLHVLKHAVEKEVLRSVDCRALLKANVQMLRMFTELFPNGIKLRPYWAFPKTLPKLSNSTFDVTLNEVNDERVPYRLMSIVLDLFLFCVESRRPNLNFLTVERVQLEALPFISDNRMELKTVDIPQASMMRWRRYLRSNENFQNLEANLASDYSSLGHWVYLAPIDGLPRGALFTSANYSIHDLKLIKPSGGNDLRAEVLANVCRKYRLEMVSSYEAEYLRGCALNILPQRIHIEEVGCGVNVTIPDFYSHDMLRKKTNGDLVLLSNILRHGVKAPKSSAPFKREELRRLGSTLRCALEEAYEIENARKFIRVIWGGLGFDPERVLGANWRATTKGQLPTLLESINIVNENIPFANLTLEQYRIWCEILYFLTATGKWEPPVI